MLCLAVVISVPLYRNYMVRSDLEIAKMNVRQGVERAKFLAQMGADDSAWGFSTDAVPGRGVVFKGESYAMRDATFDEMYSIPLAISVGGLSEVVFGKIGAVPNIAGDILLSTNAGVPLSASVAVDDDMITAIPDTFDICIKPFSDQAHTLSVTNDLWAHHERDGAVRGSCESLRQPEAPATAPGTLSLSAAAGGVRSDAGYSCTVRFAGMWPKDIDHSRRLTVETFESGEWRSPSGDASDPVAADVTSTDGVFDCLSPSISQAFDFHIRVHTWAKKRNWYDGSDASHWKEIDIIDSADGAPASRVFLDGDPLPESGMFSSAAMTPHELMAVIDFDENRFRLSAAHAVFLFSPSSDASNEATGAVFLAEFFEA